MVEDLKKLRANIAVMDICRIPLQKYFLVKALSSEQKKVATSGPERNLSSTDPMGKPTVNAYLGDRK
jgi:hypothetical protein